MAKLTDEELQGWLAILRARPLEQRENILASAPLTEEQREQIRQALRPPIGIQIPPELIEKILKGECVLFIGAGMSREAGMPGSADLIRRLGEDPTAPSMTLPIAADKFEVTYGRRKLIEELRDAFDTASKFKPKALGSFRFIPLISALNSLILTTNWDSLLEEVFDDEKESCVVIKREHELTLLPRWPHVIVKLHGDLTDTGTLVVTRRDYGIRTAALRQPVGFGAFLGTLLTTKTLIFVGYSTRDEDFKLIRDLLVAKMIDEQGRRVAMQHYAVMPCEEQEAQFLRDNYSIEVVRGTAYEFFAAVFKEIGEFVNRERELRDICETIKSPYVEIWGNAGCGKTMLLRGIEGHYKIRRDHKFIISVDFKEILESSDALLRAMARQYKLDGSGVNQFGEGLRSQLVLFTFDSTEKANAQVVRWLETTLLPRFQRMQEERAGDYRFIFAGRQPLPWGPRIRQQLYSMELSIFDSPAVEDMARRYVYSMCGKLLEKRECAVVAKEVLAVAGTGHPKLIKFVLDDLVTADARATEAGEEWTATDMRNHIRQNTPVLIERLAEVVKNEILGGCGRAVTEAVENVICVFRRFYPWMLAELHGKELPDFGVDDAIFAAPLDLTGVLSREHVVRGPDRTTPMYALDPTVRHLFDLRLKLTREPLSTRVRELALGICDSGVQATQNHFQLAYMVEGLYHHLQFQRGDARAFRDKWDAYVASLRSSQDRAILAKQLKDMLETDREILDAVLENFGEEEYEYMFQVIDAVR